MSHGFSAGRISSGGILGNNAPLEYTSGQSLTLTEQFLKRLVDRLAPSQNYYPIVISDLPTGAQEMRNLNQIGCNGIIGTLTAGEVAVYLNTSLVTNGIYPDFVFNSNGSSVFIPIPDQNYQTILIVSIGTQNAQGKIIIQRY